MTPLTLQAGPDSLTGSRDPKLGFVALKLKCHAADLPSAMLGDAPDIGFYGLVEWQPRTWTRRVGGDVEGYDVAITLEGHTAPDDPKGEEFVLQLSTKEEPIDAHWNLPVLKEVYGGTFDPNLNRTTWPDGMPESGQSEDPRTLLHWSENKGGISSPWSTALKLTGLDAHASSSPRKNPMHGVEQGPAATFTWVRRYASAILPGDLTARINTIETPPGNPPALSGNRNWRFIGATATWRGNAWQIEEKWEMSGPLGWVPEMFAHAG